MKKLAYLFSLLILLGISACSTGQKIVEQSDVVSESSVHTYENSISAITNEAETLSQNDNEAVINNNENKIETTPQDNTEVIEENIKMPTPIDTILLTLNGYTVNATLVENSSTAYLIEQLSQGDIVINMKDYDGFEKVGPFDFELPTNNEQITASAGDLILYQGNSLVIFYGTNSWSYTRLGKINDISATELSEILGSSNVTVTLSLPK